MLKYSGSVLYGNAFFVLCLILLLSSPLINAQSCTSSEDFEANQYNTHKATYHWDVAANALYYVVCIKVNSESYQISELPGSATDFAVEFNPTLKNYDKVSATLTKHCKYGESNTTTFDFIIVTDGVVYLNGGPQNGDPNTVEPVFTTNDNLIPGTDICGVCEPGFFRLTSGFYGPYGIAVDPAIPHTIEQLRFLKSELCGCLNKAVYDGVLNVGGGAGPNYHGEPFKCKLTPYVFEKSDCLREKEEDGERSSNVASSTIMAIPNPVTTATKIIFSLPEMTTVTIAAYDITGRIMSQIIHATNMPAGEYQENLSTENWPRGLYYCTMQSGNTVQKVKLVKI